MGYIEDRRSQVWEKQYGRLLLYHPSGEFPVEVFFTPILLHHDINLQHILTIERWTICLTDLVLSKLQYEVLDRKQLIDLTLLFKSHIVGNNECQTICCRRIVDSINNDWKMRYTIEKNLPHLKAFINEADVKAAIGDADSVIRKVDTIQQRLIQTHKSAIIKLKERAYHFLHLPIGRPVDYPSPDRWS
ncbi:MAG: hypothetical protein HY964_00630 [Ignavibacteriales bacterium]|nr:hypothetical protein [Ignavibacteriales bacterium]